MQECLGELNLLYVLIYLDDMIVFSRMPEEHLVRLQAVLERFLKHGLKLKPSKCHFFQMEIDYLGHKVSKDGMMLGDNSKLKGERVDFSPEALATYEDLKMKCMTAPVLAFADFEKPFMLENDALKEGLGVVLSRKQSDRHYHPVAFASHALHGGEKKYHLSKLEFLALKWAITEQFCEYLQYGHFTTRTDNNPLTYILTTPNLDAIGHRWVAALAGFNMSIKYLRGTDNKVANALSWVSIRLDKDTWRHLAIKILQK